MNPETGTFTSMDTYRGNAYDPASLHRYTYAQNNPQMYNDPSGHMIGFIALSINAGASAIVRQRHQIHVAGKFNGYMNAIVNQVFGGDEKDNVVVAFIKGYASGVVSAAAYIAATAIAALWNVKAILNTMFVAAEIIECLSEIILTLAYTVTGNDKMALTHFIIASVCLASILIDLKVEGEVSIRGSKGEASINVNTKVDSNPIDVKTGSGYGAGDEPLRIEGEWSIDDLKQALLGHPPKGLGSPDLHHGGQMPGGAKHEVLPGDHRNNGNLHPNKYNQGVTLKMRESDRQLHWWYRAREQGADFLLPDWIYDN